MLSLLRRNAPLVTPTRSMSYLSKLKELKNNMSQYQDIRKKIDAMEAEGQSQQALVKAVMNGGGELKRITINPLVGSDVKLIETLVLEACKDSHAKLVVLIKKETEALATKAAAAMQQPTKK